MEPLRTASPPLPPSGETAAVAFEGLTVDLGGVPVLEAVTAHVPRGGCTCIVGPNGAGKTTLLLAYLGQVAYGGRLQARPAVIGYVPQRFAFDRGMPLTVEEFLAMGRTRRPLWLGLGPAVRARVAAALQTVEAEHLAKRRLGVLSGGELQRVLLALALQQEPEILVLDEPAAGVDFQGEHLFCELLERLRVKRGFTQIMVTHDLGLVLHHATHVILINRRLIAQGDPRTVLAPENLVRAYGLHRGGASIGLAAEECTCHDPSKHREGGHA